jgi:hypothetical protein
VDFREMLDQADLKGISDQVDQADHKEILGQLEI